MGHLAKECPRKASVQLNYQRPGQRASSKKALSWPTYRDNRHRRSVGRVWDWAISGQTRDSRRTRNEGGWMYHRPSESRGDWQRSWYTTCSEIESRDGYRTSIVEGKLVHLTFSQDNDFLRMGTKEVSMVPIRYLPRNVFPQRMLSTPHDPGGKGNREVDSGNERGRPLIANLAAAVEHSDRVPMEFRWRFSKSDLQKRGQWRNWRLSQSDLVRRGTL